MGSGSEPTVVTVALAFLCVAKLLPQKGENKIVFLSDGFSNAFVYTSPRSNTSIEHCQEGKYKRWCPDLPYPGPLSA
jgi:hypothetical protein